MATLGLYRNSGAVVIAAMLIAPLMSPILDTSSAMVMGWTSHVIRLVFAIFVASLLTVALSFAIPFIFDAPRGIAIPAQVLARTDPGLEELAIALVSGIAGAYVQMRRREAALLPGVAIGVSLVPPLSAAGLLFYFSESALAWEAVLLFLTNFAAIVLSACVVFVALGLRPAMRKKGYVVYVGLNAFIMLVVVTLVTLVLSQHTIHRFQEARDEERVIAAIREWKGFHLVTVEHVKVSEKAVEVDLIFDVPLHFSDVVKAPVEMVSPDLRAAVLIEKIKRVVGRDVKVVYSGTLRYTAIVGPSPEE